MAQYSRPDWADKVARSPSPGKCSWCQREFGSGERRILQPKSASAHPVYPCESCFDEYLGNLGPSIKADPPWRIPMSGAEPARGARPMTIIRRVGPKLDEPFNPALPAKRGNPHMYGHDEYDYRDNPGMADEDEDLDTFGRMCVLIYDQLAFILGPAPDLSDMDEQASQYFVEEVQKFMEEGAAPTQETARQIAGDMIAHGFAWSQISRRRNPGHELGEVVQTFPDGSYIVDLSVEGWRRESDALGIGGVNDSTAARIASGETKEFSLRTASGDLVYIVEAKLADGASRIVMFPFGYTAKLRDIEGTGRTKHDTARHLANLIEFLRPFGLRHAPFLWKARMAHPELFADAESEYGQIDADSNRKLKKPKR